jgi:hypothetical protein
VVKLKLKRPTGKAALLAFGCGCDWIRTRLEINFDWMNGRFLFFWIYLVIFENLKISKSINPLVGITGNVGPLYSGTQKKSDGNVS